MNLSKWNDFLFEQEQSTVEDPPLKSTNTTARQAMLADTDDGTITIPARTSAEKHILSEMGFTLGKLLGQGKYGSVYMAQDEETGRRLAVKLIIGSSSRVESSSRYSRNDFLNAINPMFTKPDNFGFSIKFSTFKSSSNSTNPNREVGFVTVIVPIN